MVVLREELVWLKVVVSLPPPGRGRSLAVDDESVSMGEDAAVKLLDNVLVMEAVLAIFEEVAMFGVSDAEPRLEAVVDALPACGDVSFDGCVDVEFVNGENDAVVVRELAGWDTVMTVTETETDTEMVLNVLETPEADMLVVRLLWTTLDDDTSEYVD